VIISCTYENDYYLHNTTVSIYTIIKLPFEANTTRVISTLCKDYIRLIVYIVITL